MYGLLSGTLIFGVFLSLIGLTPNMFLIAGAIFGAQFIGPLMGGCYQAICQSKVPADVQGRVFATLQMMSVGLMPLSTLLVGPLADKVFEPLLAVGGPLAGNLGRVVGVGTGRGIGLIFIMMGILIVLSVIVSSFYPRLRLLDSELPDAVLPSTIPATAEESLSPAG